MSHHRDLKNAQAEIVELAVKLVDATRRRADSRDRGKGRGIDYDMALADYDDAMRRLTWATDRLKKLQRIVDALAPHSGRETSAGAAKMSAATTWRGRVQRQVFMAGYARHSNGQIRPGGGRTCDELECTIPGARDKHASISSAVNYAENHGWIRDSGVRRETRSGALAIVYEPTDLLVEMMKQERRVE